MSKSGIILHPQFGGLASTQAEARRVKLLRSLGILDTCPEPSFDGLTTAAAVASGCPVALVSLLDETRQWFKSVHGLDVEETPIAASFCAYTARQANVFEVEDTWEDMRFAANPLVVGEPYIRFYAGAPLSVDGVRLGALCVIDTQPRRLSSLARQALEGLASAASSLLAARRVELSLRQHQARLADLALASGDWMWETDASHRIQWLSSQTRGRSDSPLQGGALLPDGPLVDMRGEPLHPETSFHSHLCRSFPIARAAIAYATSGKIVHLSFSALPTVDADGKLLGFRGTARDISAAVEHEQRYYQNDIALRLERDSAQQSAKLRSELVSKVSHELRTPLNAVLGFSQLLIRGATDAVFCATQINRAATHLLGLVNDMLDLARLESGREIAELRSVPTAGAIQRCVDLLQAEAQGRGVQICCETAPGTGAVEADLRGLTQILLNLLSNALKCSVPSSAVRVIASRAENGRIEISLVDHGPGIAPEALATLFQPFGQISGSRKGTGTGLGLAISRQLAEPMGGSLSVESTIGKGSSFTVSLQPAASGLVPVPDTEFALLTCETTLASAIPLLNVLYIEDDPVNTLVLDRMIAHLGRVNLHHADTAARGRELCAALRLDLIFLDMNLPDGHGVDVLPTLRRASGTRKVPVVALSADALPEAIEAARQTGFDNYLTKPIDLFALERVLADCRAQIDLVDELA